MEHLESEPQIDMIEEGDRLILEVALPGVAEPDIDITLQGTELAILAERPEPKAAVVRREIRRGILERHVTLPWPAEIAQARLEDGILRLSLARI